MAAAGEKLPSLDLLPGFSEDVVSAGLVAQDAGGILQYILPMSLK